MDSFEALTKLTVIRGVTADESAVSCAVREMFCEYTSDVWTDTLGNTYAKMGDPKGPVVLMMAHMDEVGMMVTAIEPNGMLRLRSANGVDPRVLPASTVIVHGRERLVGVVSASPTDPDKADDASYTMEELICDLGLTYERATELVSVGDYATFEPAPPMKLKNNRIAGKTFDDRACICALLEAMKRLKDYNLHCCAVFCASVQEEIGGGGASTGTYGVNPDIGIALDVCHAPQPGAKPYQVSDFAKPSICKGANIHPKMYKLLSEAAKSVNVDFEPDPAFSHTGTDAWDMQVQRGGIPTGLISLPLRYMHTSVELISLDTLTACGKILAAFLSGLDDTWEEKLCLDD
ncbi:MAG TPA: M20/M25/M40 family metallo-hydrolase [Eubacteriales bacterium]|nr:M20/M25/M40 family metallo-hydrolase [Clostridia bacterium]HRV72637.1 M20/M25/M40 family metallo-hydrolase [Eubacteriales bacterium]